MYRFRFVSFIVITFFSACSSLLFYPSQLPLLDPQKFYRGEDLLFRSEDRTILHGFYFSAINAVSSKSTLVLHFHGNAENLSTHFFQSAWMTHYGMDVFIFDYRGYGQSEGTPTPPGLVMDGKAAILESLAIMKKKGLKKLIIFAQSLGGIVAQKSLLELAIDSKFSELKKVELVILDSTFANFKKIGKLKLQQHWLTYLFSPLSYLLLSNATAPEKDLKNWHFPVLMMHDPQDPVVPYELGKENFAKFGNLQKWWWDLPLGGTHAQTFGIGRDEWNNKLIKFISWCDSNCHHDY